MMQNPERILVFQTAFLGDVILTLPMIQLLKKRFPSAAIDVVTTPRAAALLRHPAVSTVILYDKRNAQKGIAGMLSMVRSLRANKYDVAVIPHRSLRSSLVTALSGIPVRIGFSTATGKMFYTDIVRYIPADHEIDRNIALLMPLQIRAAQKELPSLYPSDDDTRRVARILFEREVDLQQKIVTVAPGSVWNTKRWLAERFADLSLALAKRGYEVLIVGGKEDEELGSAIVESAGHKRIHNLTGVLSLLESAEAIRRSDVLVTNDSAPLHIGVAVRTPVVAIFGATVPAFGFGPYGEHDVVVETNGLHCRPCAIHGGNRCPIGTFECMKKIEVTTVLTAVLSAAQKKRVS